MSQEATKLSLAFSKPPVPSQQVQSQSCVIDPIKKSRFSDAEMFWAVFCVCLQEGEKLVESVLKSVLTLSAVYYWLPKTHGNHQAFRTQLDWITGPGFVASQLLPTGL